MRPPTVAEILNRSQEILKRYFAADLIPITFGFYNFLVELIQKAQTRIYIATYNIIGTNENTRQIFYQLAKAKQRGADVQILINTRFSTQKSKIRSENSVQLLRELGLKVIQHPPSRILHAKFIVIDYEHCIIGSHNLTDNSVNHNVELSLYVNSEGLADDLAKFFKEIRDAAEYENELRQQQQQQQKK